MNAVEVMRWIDTNVPLGGLRHNEKVRSLESLLEAACWFCACQEAEAIQDGLRIKDIADIIQDPDQLPGPFRTTEDVDVWVNTHYQYAAEDLGLENAGEMSVAQKEETWAGIVDLLLKHFGLVRRANP